jgi:hypothetical protein
VGAFGGVDAVPSREDGLNLSLLAELGGVCLLTRTLRLLYGVHTEGDALDRETPA